MPKNKVLFTYPDPSDGKLFSMASKKASCSGPSLSQAGQDSSEKEASIRNIIIS